MAGVDADADAVVTDRGERGEGVTGRLDGAAGYRFQADAQEPVSSWRASRRSASVVSAVCAAVARSWSYAVRQARGRVEMLPSVTSSGRSWARTRARSVVWARRSGRPSPAGRRGT